EKNNKDEIFIITDRIVIKNEEDFYNRLADAVDTAFYEGKGVLFLQKLEDNSRFEFSNLFELDVMTFTEPTTHLFSFNNPYGASPVCEGYGNIIGIDEELVIPDSSLSIFEGAVAAWKGETMSWYKDQLVKNAYKFDFPIHKPYFELTEQQRELVWTGNKYFTGLNGFFAELESQNYKIQNRVLLSRYRGKTKCHACKGKRLKTEANYVKINGMSISDLVDMPIIKLIPFFENLELNDYEKQVSKRL